MGFRWTLISVATLLTTSSIEAQNPACRRPSEPIDLFFGVPFCQKVSRTAIKQVDTTLLRMEARSKEWRLVRL